MGLRLSQCSHSIDIPSFINWGQLQLLFKEYHGKFFKNDHILKLIKILNLYFPLHKPQIKLSILRIRPRNKNSKEGGEKKPNTL